MEESNIHYIEQGLKVRLPDFYKAFLLNIPQDLLEGARTLSRDRGNKRLLLAISTDSQGIVQVNHDFREAIDSSGDADAHNLAEKYLAIGQEEGYPNFYVVDLTGRARGVFLYDHEQAYCEPRYSSLEKFVAELLEAVDVETKESGSKQKKSGRRSHFGDDPDEMGYDQLDWKKE